MQSLAVYKQIETALEKMASSSPTDQEMMKAILKRYAEGNIGLDEAYYELLDEELIPMPQRCCLSTKIQTSAEDEQRLKEKIMLRLST
jgi:hypothetical protein